MSDYYDANDYAAIHAQAQEIMRHRKRIKRSTIARYMNYFDNKCAESKRHAELAKKVIPGGIQHNLANNHPFPLSIEKVDRGYIYDVDGNRYIDFLCAGGPTILGNNYPAVTNAIVEQIQKRGSVYGLYCDYERQLSELVCKYYPTVEMYRMMGSGTEADIVALRLARAFTGKKHIIRINGGYHGWSDQVVFNANAINGSSHLLHGIPTDCIQNTHSVPVNDLAILEQEMKKYENDGGVAAFFMEAVGQDSGAVPTTREYHVGAEKLCREHGVLLVYDEVVTGFRLGMGGAQAMWGTKPDITVFGKIIGGGYPCCGGIGARAEIMDMLQAGTGADSMEKVRVGGTLTANPVTALAGIVTIKELQKENVHEKLDKAASYFMQGVADLTKKYDVPAIVFNHSSILHVDVAGLQHIAYCFDKNDPAIRQQTIDAYMGNIEFSMGLAAEGLIIANGGKTYMCYDTVSMVDDALAVYEKVLREFE